MNIPMNERIRSRRRELGLTQEELAHALGLQKSAIAKYESGRVRNIKQNVLMKMAEVLDCSPSWLLGCSDAPNGTSHGDSLPEDSLYILELFSSLEEPSRQRVLEYCRHLKRIQELEQGLP